MHSERSAWGRRSSVATHRLSKPVQVSMVKVVKLARKVPREKRKQQVKNVNVAKAIKVPS